MNIYIFENNRALNLEPITLTRPVFDIRCGALTCIERLNFLLPDDNIHLLVRPELEEVTKETFPENSINPENIDEGIWLLGNALWNEDAVAAIKDQKDSLFFNNHTLIGANLAQDPGKGWIVVVH